MKTNLMKKLLVLTMVVAGAEVVHAEGGGPDVHVLSCSVPVLHGIRINGTGYTLTCTTQAVAPEYSIKSCTLSSNAVVASPADTNIPIHQTSQNGKEANFIGRDLEVKLFKKQFRATIAFSSGAKSECLESNE